MAHTTLQVSNRFDAAFLKGLTPIAGQDAWGVGAGADAGTQTLIFDDVHTDAVVAALNTYDAAWLAWQDEIGKRHHRIGKNKTDGVSAAPHIPMSQLLALSIPISVTVRPFLAKSGNSPDDVNAMHAAWTKSVWLHAILWSRPYVIAGDF